MNCDFPNGCFRQWWYPQIIHFNRGFHHKPSILGYHYFWKHPNGHGFGCFPHVFFSVQVGMIRFMHENIPSKKRTPFVGGNSRLFHQRKKTTRKENHEKNTTQPWREAFSWCFRGQVVVVFFQIFS